MQELGLARTIAYCGLVCGVCVHAMAEREACPGCRRGGGDKRCYQRTCCQDNGLQGCWECGEFESCSRFEFLKPIHGDANVNNLKRLKKLGIDRFLATARQR
jgi:hypothetical protein